MKHAIFQGGACSRTDYACQNATAPYTYNYTHQQWCQQFALDVSANHKIIPYKWTGKWTFAQMAASQIIDDSDKFYRASIATSMDEKNGDQSNTLFNGGWRGKFRQATFDRNVFMKMYAFNKNKTIAQGGFHTNKLLGEDYFVDKTMDKNVITFYGLIFQRNSDVFHSATDTFTSALSSKLTSELDAKIDDGRPTTGKMLGIKPSKAYNETDAERIKAYCYDAAGNDIQHAIYNVSTNTQYGCDFTIVMEDVK